MMNLEYRKATIDDLDLLTKTRIEVLRAANNLDNLIDMWNKLLYCYADIS